MTGERTSNRTALLAAAGVLLVVLVLAAWWWSRGGEDDGSTATPGAGGDGESQVVELYFPGPQALLEAESRRLDLAEDPEARLTTLAQALTAGPTDDALFPPLPAGVSVRSVSLGEGGVVYIDLVSEENGPPPSGGSTEERLRVYSLVDTLLLNVEGAESAVILWNGTQPQTFSGHLDLSRPLLPNPDLIAR